MSEPIQAYPLAWPSGWKRVPSYARKQAQFIGRDKAYINVTEGVRRVLAELDRLGVKEDDVVISSNIRPTLSGRASESTGKVEDPGVCVYWKTKAAQRNCIAIDRYTGIAGNLGAIAATLEAMRAIERHGGAEILDRAFTGFTALPAPEQWFTILGCSANATREQIETAYRALAMKYHPDRPGGNAGEMSRINTARDEGLQHATNR